jgi:hypothetical protein
MKRSWKIVGLVAGALLVNAPQASADLKSVFTAVCVADDDALITTAGPTTRPGKPTPAVCSFVPPECRTLMLCMDQAGWHVIHDTRYGGAWFDLRGGTPGTPLYKLIFQKD